jgi:hypothetical protein
VLNDSQALKAVIGAFHTPSGDMIARSKYEYAEMHLTITHKETHPKLKFWQAWKLQDHLL